MPQKIGFVSRLRSSQARLPDGRVGIGPSTHPGGSNLPDGYEPAELVSEVECAEGLQAIERTNLLIERVMDRLAFDLQQPIGIVQTDVIDITPPVAIGDSRQFHVFHSYPGDLFARAEEVGGTATEQAPGLNAGYADPGPKLRAALRWYVKALEATYLHDRFIFLWIATEIFADEAGSRVLQPTRLRCGHVLLNCPECGKPTESMIRGESIRAYLEAHGLAPDDAQKAWRLRQMMHGAIPFDSGELASLARLVLALRAVVVRELKSGLGIAPSAAPVVSPDRAVLTHPGMGLGGVREVVAADLTWP